jgi:hypothetical protein
MCSRGLRGMRKIIDFPVYSNAGEDVVEGVIRGTEGEECENPVDRVSVGEPLPEQAEVDGTVDPGALIVTLALLCDFDFCSACDLNAKREIFQNCKFH